jgi:cytochrome c-type biogenesis protein CcmE
MKAKTKIMIAMGIIIVTISVLMITGFLNMSGRSVSIEQVLAPGFEYEGKFLRIEGELLEGYVYSAAQLTLEFQITDGERILNVIHDGYQPDNFYEGVIVIVTGNYRADDGVFVADTVQTRCPSTYEEEIRGEGGENPTKGKI